MRSTKKVVTRCTVALVAWTLMPPVWGQDPAQQPAQQPVQEPAQESPVLKSEVSLVNIFATVRDKQKHIVPTLKQEDFRIFENEQEQKIAFFSSEKKLPVTLGLLIDTSPSEQYRLPAEQDAASHFLSQVLQKGDEAMVLSFDLDVDLLSDFTDDRAQLQRAIHHARIGGGGPMLTPGTIPTGPDGTHLYDAIWVACGEKLSTEAGRKALVIVTDAEDFGSKVSVLEAIEAAERTNTVVHFLLVHDPGYGWRPDIAHKISDQTGGRVIEVRSQKNLQEAFDQISEELRSEYSLGYYPSNAARDGTFRKIKVETTNHDMKVLARKGYYAPKGSG